MRIYTRSGDKGTTSLVYGRRIPKNDPRVEAYGTIDEANSLIGLALSFLDDVDWEGKQEFLNIMHRVQTVLFHVGAEISTPLDREVAWKLEQRHIDELEKQIDEWNEQLPELKQFILPSGHKVSSALHLARTVVRRAERSGSEHPGSNSRIPGGRLFEPTFRLFVCRGALCQQGIEGNGNSASSR